MKSIKLFLTSLVAGTALFFGCNPEPITGYDLSSLKVDNSYVQIDPAGSTAKINLTATEAWNLYVRTSYEYKNASNKTVAVDTLITPGTSCNPRGIKNALESWIAVDPVSGGSSAEITITATAFDGYRTQDVRIVGESGAEIVLTVAQGEDVTKEYKASEAIALVQAGKQSGSPVLVKGIICKIDEISTSYGNATYYISDDGTFKGSYNEDGSGDGNWLEIYRGYWIGGEKFTKGDEIAMGDEVTIKGVLISYKGTPETNQNTAEVVSIKKALVKVEPSAFASLSQRDTTVVAAVQYSGDNLNYAIDSVGRTFLSIVGTESVADTTFVSIHVAKNTDPVSRTGVVTVISANDKAKSMATVTITQAGDAQIVNITQAIALPKATAVLVKDAVVAAKSTAGFVATDGTSAVYVYDNGANAVALGDKVEFSAETDVYNGVPELKNVANFKVASSGNTVTYPVAAVLNDEGFDTYTSSVASYVCFYGTLKLTKNTDGSVKYANVEIDGATFQGSLTKPLADLNLAELEDKVVTVTGYYNGFSGGKYHNVIATSVVEGVSVPIVFNYKKVAAVTSGKEYIITYTEESVTYMATVITDATKSYGYYYTLVVEPKDDVITLSSDDNAVIISQSGDGWLIKQKVDDRYAYCDGSHGSVQLSADVPANLWTLTMEDGAAVFSFSGTNSYRFGHTLYNTTHEFCPIKNSTDASVVLYERK